jgi:hypothetical protein
VRPVVGVELAIALEVDVSLRSSERKDVSDLRADADDAGFEGAHPIAASTVARELVVDITHGADQQLLGEKLRGAPVEVKVEAVLIIGIRIDVIMGEAGNG